MTHSVPISQCSDIMVDIETTGLSPDRSGILQIAAVPFNLSDFTVGDTYFDMSLHMLEGRAWDPSTQKWWSNKSEVLKDIQNRAQDPKFVMYQLQNFVLKMSQPARFWCNRMFDWQFIESYYRDCNLTSPFAYWDAREMRSYLDGICFPNHTPIVKPVLLGELHNAYVDVRKQIEEMFLTIEDAKGPRETLTGFRIGKRPRQKR